MQTDIEKYRKHVEHFDLTDIQKDELIHNVKNIVVNFIDRAFQQDGTQLALKDKYSSIAKDAFDGGPVINLKANVMPSASSGLLSAFNNDKNKERP
jgi:hypothetical protein